MKTNSLCVIFITHNVLYFEIYYFPKTLILFSPYLSREIAVGYKQ